MTRLKHMKLFLTSVMLMFFLFACENETANTNSSEQVKETKQPEKAAENQGNLEPEKTAETPVIQKSEITLEEAKVILDDLVKNITDVYIEAGEEFNLIENPLTDEVFESISKSLQPFASEHLINTKLNIVAKEFCYSGCDASYFPGPTAYGLRFQQLDSSSEKVTFEYIVPENELAGHAIEKVSLINDGGKWKLDSYDFSTQPLQLTREEAEKILQINGYNQYEFVKQSETNSGTVYLFHVNGDSNEQISVSVDTGYLNTVAADQTMTEDTTKENTAS